MRTAGLMMSDAWAHRVLRDATHEGVEVTSIVDEPVELLVVMDSMRLVHHGPDRNYRPYLHLRGRLQALRPLRTALPGSVTEVGYDGDLIAGAYEFTDEQLGELVAKGYFQPGFDVPEQVLGIEWELPATADLAVVRGLGEAESMMVFSGVHRMLSLQLDKSNSDYDLVEYFAQVQPGTQMQSEQEVDALEKEQPEAEAEAMRGRDDEIHSLFADVEQELTQLIGQTQSAREQAQSAGEDFNRMLAEEKARRGLEAEVEQELPTPPQAGVSDVDVEALYNRWVLGAEEVPMDEDEEQVEVKTEADAEVEQERQRRLQRQTPPPPAPRPKTTTTTTTNEDYEFEI